MKTLGQELVARLAVRGVEVVFGIPGVHTVELYRGLAGAGIRHVTARHEQGAAFMADGYARVAGKPGVAFVITGPGLTNTLTALAQARADSVPILVISGLNSRASLGKGLGHLHELPDQGAAVRAICPSFQINCPENLEPVLNLAFAAMLSGRPGPAHIEIPLDVMALPCAPPHHAPIMMPAAPVPVDAEPAAQWMNGLKRPVILAGGGAARAGAALQAFAMRLDAPVVLTANARGLMHGHDLLVPASASLPAVRELMAQSDGIIAVGTELGPTDYDVYARGGLPDLSNMARIDICPLQLARHPCAHSLRGEAGAVMDMLLPHLAPRRINGAARAAATRRAARAELAGFNPDMLFQLQMVEAIRAAMPNAIIVGDSTQPVYAGNLYYDHDRPSGWFNAATGYGALGFAPGAAVGAALAAAGTPVVCLIGDGGLQFSPGELRTAVDERLPVTFVIWNNGGFREIADAMQAVHAPVIGCDPSPLKMEPFAAACDLPYVKVGMDADALRTALAAPARGPRLVEVRVS